MRTECGELHPDFADIVCDVTVPAHPWHRGWSVVADGYVDWQNESYVPPVKTDPKAAAGKLKEMAGRVAPAPHVDDDEPPCRRQPQTCAVEREGHFCAGDGMDPEHEVHECRCGKSWTANGFLAGLADSEQAARRWTDDEKKIVLAAIISVAMDKDEFTTDDVWEELAGRVPVTKGMTAMLKLADRKDILGNTGKTVISQRGGQHDHGQRLTIWFSLIKKKVSG